MTLYLTQYKWIFCILYILHHINSYFKTITRILEQNRAEFKCKNNTEAMCQKRPWGKQHTQYIIPQNTGNISLHYLRPTKLALLVYRPITCMISVLWWETFGERVSPTHSSLASHWCCLFTWGIRVPYPNWSVKLQAYQTDCLNDYGVRLAHVIDTKLECIVGDSSRVNEIALCVHEAESITDQKSISITVL